MQETLIKKVTTKRGGNFTDTFMI